MGGVRLQCTLLWQHTACEVTDERENNLSESLNFFLLRSILLPKLPGLCKHVYNRYNNLVTDFAAVKYPSQPRITFPYASVSSR